MSKICDVCNADASGDSAKIMSVQQFKEAVESGFTPDEQTLAIATYLGVSKEKALANWRTETVGKGTTAWLLCEACHTRMQLTKGTATTTATIGNSASWSVAEVDDEHVSKLSAYAARLKDRFRLIAATGNDNVIDKFIRFGVDITLNPDHEWRRWHSKLIGGMKLQGACWYQATLHSVSFVHADCRSASFEDALLYNCDFTKSNCAGANFTKVKIFNILHPGNSDGANFDFADFTEGYLSGLTARGASFKGANFTNALITDIAVDEKTDFTDVKFNGCTVTMPKKTPEDKAKLELFLSRLSESQRKELKGATAGPKAGCFIATACYGSYDHPNVREFRVFRDKTLATSAMGRFAVATYYKFSPRFAEHLRQNPRLAGIIRDAILHPLLRLVRSLNRLKPR